MKILLVYYRFTNLPPNPEWFSGEEVTTKPWMTNLGVKILAPPKASEISGAVLACIKSCLLAKTWEFSENITSPDDSQCYTAGTQNDEDVPCQTILSGLMSVWIPAVSVNIAHVCATMHGCSLRTADQVWMAARIFTCKWCENGDIICQEVKSPIANFLSGQAPATMRPGMGCLPTYLLPAARPAPAPELSVEEAIFWPFISEVVPICSYNVFPSKPPLIDDFPMINYIYI